MLRAFPFFPFPAFVPMRSVVLKPTSRCSRCLLPPRWCICSVHEDIRSPLQVDLLIHPRELNRPSSTGALLTRVMPEARRHVWDHQNPPTPEQVIVPGRDVWILHPHGRPAPAGAQASEVQVLLLDGLWNETSTMARSVSSWGRLVNLPMTGESRFWLRAQKDGGRFSTLEALMFVLDTVDQASVSAALRLQLELHVYATLRARGRTGVAADFLASSPLPAALPEFLQRFHTRRPLEARVLPASNEH